MATRASERTVERDRQEQEKKSMYSRKRGMKWCVNESHSFFPGSGHETHMRVASVTWRCGFSTSRSQKAPERLTLSFSPEQCNRLW